MPFPLELKELRAKSIRIQTNIKVHFKFLLSILFGVVGVNFPAAASIVSRNMSCKAACLPPACSQAAERVDRWISNDASDLQGRIWSFFLGQEFNQKAAWGPTPCWNLTFILSTTLAHEQKMKQILVNPKLGNWLLVAIISTPTVKAFANKKPFGGGSGGWGWRQIFYLALLSCFHLKNFVSWQRAKLCWKLELSD